MKNHLNIKVKLLYIIYKNHNHPFLIEIILENIYENIKNHTFYNPLLFLVFIQSQKYLHIIKTRSSIKLYHLITQNFFMAKSFYNILLDTVLMVSLRSHIFQLAITYSGITQIMPYFFIYTIYSGINKIIFIFFISSYIPSTLVSDILHMI